MIIDAHTHLFSPDVMRHRSRYAERDAFFGYLYSGTVARMVSVEEMIAAMDKAGIDQAIVTGWCWQNHADCVEQNSWTMDVVRKYPGRLRALAAIQPHAGAEAIRELERCVAGGMVGLGELNADGQSFRLDDKSFRMLAHRAAELNVAMLLHTNEPVGHQYPGKGQLPLSDIYDLAKADSKFAFGARTLGRRISILRIDARSAQGGGECLLRLRRVAAVVLAENLPHGHRHRRC